ncbi:MAG TPA: TetR/AcrR family transcriptional regulator [Gammaproteobacteria bacterium]|nr:TetR/AcrR family transcriptional regulator [Gammaproteobacteria bacterium]
MKSETQAAVRSERNPDATRQRILQAAFEEIYRKGFQGMRLDDLLAATGLTKGALYHHFTNKQALGYAVVDEVIRPMVEDVWIRPLEAAADPLVELIGLLEHIGENMGERLVTVGCPLNNLAQEMSPLDEGFRERLGEVFGAWRSAVAGALERAKQQGNLRSELDTERTATFVVAALEGGIGLSKNAQDPQRFAECSAALVDYLGSLGPQGAESPRIQRARAVG